MSPFTAGRVPAYAVVFYVSFVCWLGFEAWVYSRDRGRKRGEASKTPIAGGGGGGWVFLAFFIAITLGFNLPGVAPGFDIRSEARVYFIIGIVLVWAGILLRLWAIQTLGRLFSTQLVIQEQHELVTSGPYKHLRNPSYSAALLTFLGFGLAVGNWLSVAVLFIAPLMAYIFRIRAEEKMLRETFGKTFESYKERSWALIPFVW